MFHSECFIKAEGRGLRRALRRLSLCRERTLEVHSPHTAARHGRGWRLLLWRFRDHGLGRHQQAGDRRCVLQRGAHDLGGIDDAAVDQVHVVLGLRVEAEGLGLVLHDLADHDRALDAGVFGDLPRGDSSALSTMLMPACTSALPSVILPTAFLARRSATPPPGTIPSSTAARVALSASSTRSFFSLTSISVAPPTRITATPPASLASRSCSFSRS